MESVTTAAKSAIQAPNIIKAVVATLVVFAIFDLLNISDYLVRPVTMAKARFGTAPRS